MHLFSFQNVYVDIAYYLLLHKYFRHSTLRLFAFKRKTLPPPRLPSGKHSVRKPVCVCVSWPIYKWGSLLFASIFFAEQNSLPEFSKKYLIFSFVLIWKVMVSESYLLSLYGSKS